jgi:hypothetical protein
VTSTIEPDGLRSGRNWGMAMIRDRLGHITATQRLGSTPIPIRENLRPVCWPWLKRSWVPTEDEPRRASIAWRTIHSRYQSVLNECQGDLSLTDTRAQR